MSATRRIAGDFLRALIAAVPYTIHTVLTDNGTHFVDNTPEPAIPMPKAALFFFRSPQLPMKAQTQ